jgi:hypothetical protein
VHICYDLRETPVKHTIKTVLLSGILVWIVAFFVGGIKLPIPVDQSWSQPTTVTGTQSADMGGGNLYKWHDTLMLVQSRYDYAGKSSTCSIMIRNNDSSNSWVQIPISDVPGDSAFYCPAFDETNDRIMFERGYIESNQLYMGAVFIHMTANVRAQVESERKWTRDQESLLGETDPNVTLNDPAILARLPKVNRDYPCFGKGTLTKSEACIPFSLRTKKCTPPNTLSDGPYWSGLFHTADFGESWSFEKVAEWDGGEPEICRTKSYCYYFGMAGRGIWFSRKPVDGLWSEPKFLTETFAGSRGGGAVVENDTVHFCWLDRRHEKWRLSIDDMYVGNYEVFYRQRKDSDPAWRKDVIVSKGMLFSHWPSMSVEGEKIVIAWVGAINNNDAHDVFYATSKDGGETWARPLKVTDHAKDGITSERTQVALQNGIIHLFYVQGQWDRHEQVWNQGSWPVYYQQRPFPK